MGYSYVYPPLGDKGKGHGHAQYKSDELAGPEIHSFRPPSKTKQLTPSVGSKKKSSFLPNINPQKDIQNFMSTLSQKFPFKREVSHQSKKYCKLKKARKYWESSLFDKDLLRSASY